MSNTELTPTVSTSGFVLSAENMLSISKFAEFMATGTIMVPEHLRNKPADCAAVSMQALRWGMDPFAVAQKTHLVSGTLGYEAQLVNAVVSSSTAIVGRFHYDYSPGWENLNGKVSVERVEKTGKNGKYFSEQPVKKWTNEDELNLWVRVGAVLRGETEITWGEKLFLANVLVRNSPLWVTKPEQQASYLAVKYWARLYTPAVTLGVYTPDELQDFGEPHEKDITPKSTVAEMLNAAASGAIEGETTTINDRQELQLVIKAIRDAANLDDLKSASDSAAKLPEKLQPEARAAYRDKSRALKKQQEEKTQDDNSKSFAEIEKLIGMANTLADFEAIDNLPQWEELSKGEAPKLRHLIEQQKSEASAEELKP
jgi:hypothetical protein